MTPNDERLLCLLRESTLAGRLDWNPCRVNQRAAYQTRCGSVIFTLEVDQLSLTSAYQSAPEDLGVSSGGIGRLPRSELWDLVNRTVQGVPSLDIFEIAQAELLRNQRPEVVKAGA